MGEKLGVGLLGCGAFGRFCLREFGAMPGLRAAAVADMIPEAARKTGEEFGLPVCADIHALAARDDVQIIHIATPPSTHCELAIAGLLCRFGAGGGGKFGRGRCRRPYREGISTEANKRDVTLLWHVPY